jgi:hypothetical protein
MAIQYQRWERRDGANRDALGKAALSYCRALRTDTRSARFYWATPDTVTILVQAPEVSDFYGGAATPEGARATFTLSDLASMAATENWTDAGRGEQTFRAAQQGQLAGSRN